MIIVIRLCKNVVPAVALVILLAGPINSQTTAARPDRGFMPGASYSVSDVENISLTNGNVNLNIPLASLPPIAGGKLKLTLSAIYNSKLWNITRHENQGGTFSGCPNWVVDTPQVSDVAGWTIGGGYRITFREVRDDFDYAIPDSAPWDPYGSCEPDYQEYQRLFNTWRRAVLIGPDGAEHELRPTDGYQPYGGNARSYLLNYYKDTPDTINQPMRYYSFDGSFLWVVINPSSYSTRWTIYMNDGTRVVQLSNGIQRITDNNGNSIKIYFDTEGSHFQDEQTGREIKYTYDPGGNNGKGQGHVLYQTVGGTWKSIDINFDTTRVQGKLYRVSAWQEWGGETGGGMQCWHDNLLQDDLSVIREIIFPVTEPGQAGRKYSFGYNSDTTTSATDNVRWACGMGQESYTRTVSPGMGSLNQMDTPSGASVHYSYSKDGRHSFSPLGETDDIPRETITQKALTHDGVTDTWNYSIYEWGACGGTVTGPDGSVTVESCYPHDAGAGAYNASLPKGGLVFKSNHSNKEIVERHWSLLPFTGGNTGATGNWGSNTFNPVVDAEYVTLLDDSPNHNPVKMSAKTYVYDYNGNRIQETDYDWFDPSLVSRDSGGEPTGVPASATVLRVVNNSYYNDATYASSANVYAKRSLSTAAPLILGAAQQTTVGPAITQFSYDGQAYGVTPTVGNPTSQRFWDDLDSKWITSSQTYGAYGNVSTTTDARGKITQFFYDDSTHALPNRVVVDPENGTGTQTITKAYDYYTNSVTSETDANGIVSTIDYTNQLLGTADPFGRPGMTVGPLVNAGGVNQHRRVTTTYLDSSRQLIVAADVSSENDKLAKTRTTSDMLGRPILTEQTEDGTNYTISARRVYEQMGKITYTSNPARSAAASSDGWRRSTTDILGRVIEVASFGSASQPPATGTNGNWTGSVTTVYDANKTTVTDQAGKARRSEVDGLGRMVNVVEDPASLAYQTSYTYDVFGNLRTVSQGAQSRTFTYDSLSRLRTAANPESGTVSYTYDDNGNLLTKQDARSITTTLSYDGINRVTAKTYTDGTPRVDYFYDTQNLPGGAPSFDRGYAKGRLVASTYGGGSAGTYRGYDAAGGVLRQIQQTDSTNYLVEASYNLTGSMATETYPAVPGAADRRVITFSYDSSARLSALNSNATSYAPAASVSGISYGPHNSLISETYGNSLIHAVTFNSRLQPNEIKLGTSGAPTSVVGLTYNYGSSNNNGNLQSVSYSGGGLSYTQSFGYDQLNRLTTSNENGGASWSQTNAYDRYGNRWIDLGGGNQSLYFNTNNRITNAGYSYDSAGNLLNDGVHTYTYDGENKISKVDNVSAYIYDGEGQRVRKLVGENLRLVYGIGGQQLAEFDGANGTLKKEYIYGASGLVATIEPAAVNANGTRYTTSDYLGSPRLVTNSGAGVVSRHDYMPFGEALGSGVGGRSTGIGFVADGIRLQFTLKERDNETGLDYFGARYYGSIQGRFTSPDPLMASAETGDPQSWNRYSYALNNPLRYIDPDGMKSTPVFGDYKDLSEEERRILENSKVTVGKGKNAQTLSGQQLYDYMKGNQQKQLANFLNQTAVLASVTFANGRSALSYVNSVSNFKADRIIANVDAGLIDQVRSLSSTDASKDTAYVGPEDSSSQHKDFDTSFRENRAYTSQQSSFNSKLKFGAADIDIDEECPYCGSKAAALKHAGRVIVHKLFGGKTDAYDIYGRLTADPKTDSKGRGLRPSYTIVK